MLAVQWCISNTGVIMYNLTFLKLSKPLWVSPPVMGLIQLSSASRIKKEVLLSLCLLFLCVVCSIITRCTHTLFGGWGGGSWYDQLSLEMLCCRPAEKENHYTLWFLPPSPQSLPSRQLQIDLYVSTSFISAPSSRPPVAGSLRVTPSKRA